MSAMAAEADFVQEVLNRTIDVGDGSKPRLIKTFSISATKDLVLTQENPERPERVVKVSHEGGLEVFGERIRIVGSLSVPSGIVRIFCRHLEIISHDGQPVVIDVSGEDGQNGQAMVEKSGAITAPPVAGRGQAGKGLTDINANEFCGDRGDPGMAGLAAGAIIICAESLDAPSGVELRANGGHGGSGSKGGDGCIGQHGAMGWWKKTGMNQSIDGFELGQPGGAGGHGGAGGPGGSGGSAGFIVCNIKNYHSSKLLVLSANAGDGGNGGKGGDGGQGGHGGDGVNNFTHAYEGGNAGAGGNAGKPGAGGAGGRGGQIAVPDEFLEAKMAEAHTKPGVGNEPGLIGKPGHAGKPGKGRLCPAMHVPAHPTSERLTPNYEVFYPPENYDSDGALKAADGYPAADGTPVKPLKKGNNGTKGMIFKLPHQDNRKDFIDVPVSSLSSWMPKHETIMGQLRLLYEHNALIHLMTDLRKSSNEGLIISLKWIADICEAIAASSISSAVKSDASSLAVIARIALSYVVNQLDYFGQDYTRVELRSIGELHQTLSESFEQYRLVDQKAKKESEHLREVSDRNRNAQTFASFYNEEISFLKKALSNSRHKLAEKANAVHRSETYLGRCRDRVMPELAHLRDEIKTVFRDVSPERLISAMGQLAFAESPGMGAILGSACIADQVNEVRGWVKRGLESDAGNFYDEKLIVNKVERLERGLDNLKDGFRRTLDGTIEIEDPNARRLMTFKEDFSSLCQEFYGTSPAARKAQKALDKFVDAVQMRNGHIAEYNALVVDLVEKTVKLEAIRGELESLEQGVASSSDPFVAVREAGIARRRRAALQIIVQEMYQIGRVVMFWKLQPFDAFAGSDNGIGFDSLGIDALQTKMIKILESVGEIADYPFKYVPPKEGPNWLASPQKGVLIEFDREYEDLDFEALLQGETVRAYIPISSSHEDDALDPFNAMAACRVLELRAWLRTDTFLRAPVHFRITRLEEDEFIDRTKQHYSLSHPPVGDDFLYDNGHPAYVTGDSEVPDSCEIQRYWGPWRNKCEKLERIVPIGPFGYWEVQLPTELNARLKEELESENSPKVKGLTLEFRCIYEPFEAW